MLAPDQGPVERCTVAIVGGGTAGLALAAELRRLGVDNVVVLEREEVAGGIPRHCGHYPFGVREYRRLLKGPAYAERNVSTALRLGVDIRTGTTVTKLLSGGKLELTNSAGMGAIQADRVVLCMGVREGSRAQRFIGGDRPDGILTTGALQSMVYLKGMRPFQRPVILGSELVSFSAIETCRHLGIRPIAMIEEQDRIVTHSVLQPFLMVRGVPLVVNARSPRILGQDRVEAIAFTDAQGRVKRIATDGVIMSGRFRPEAALLRQSHLAVDPGSGGPVINQYGQCSDPTYYSAGNLLRPAESSGWCWQEGVDTARRIAQDLASADTMTHPSIRLDAIGSSIRFVVPQMLTLSDRPNGMRKCQIGLSEPVNGHLVARSGGRTIWEGRINSRPVRRILMPLTGILRSRPTSNIELSVEHGQ